MTNIPNVTVQDLKERGWTDSIIRDYLGAPDLTKPNTTYKSAAPMRLYDLARAEAVEATNDWTDLMEKTARRKASGLKAAATKHAHMSARLAAMVITVPSMPLSDVIVEACDSYNWHQNQKLRERRYYDYDDASPSSDPAFLLRITVNFLRHEMSQYDVELAHTYGKVGVRMAYAQINRKVYDAIAAAYPDLADECVRQVTRKESGAVQSVAALASAC